MDSVNSVDSVSDQTNGYRVKRVTVVGQRTLDIHSNNAYTHVHRKKQRQSADENQRSGMVIANGDPERKGKYSLDRND